MMSTEYIPTDYEMDPGSPYPTQIKVQRRQSSRRMSLQDMFHLEDDCEWILKSKLASNPEQLEEIALRCGVALQSCTIVKPHVKCLVRVPLDTHDQAECFIRYTCDGWATYTDISGKYYSEATGIAFQNTMAFDVHLDIPSDANEIEFAICFKANDGNEYWDNNLGLNHRLEKFVSEY
eukprot:m.14871 g.14871  ORF g.14871 m.14871 type:complete len:178 (+) comp4385_c0_seq1:215-748(+)